MKFSRVVLFGFSCLAAVLVGCSKKEAPKPKAEITVQQRKEAMAAATEAQLAITLRDFPRAENLFQKAANSAPDNADYWMNLGMVQVKLNKKGDAKKSYEAAASAYKDALDGDKDNRPDPGSGLQRIMMLALLGRLDEARAEQASLYKRFPDDRDVKAFVESKELDRILKDPGFQGSAI